MKFLCAVLICVFSLGFISCGNRPAYSNINTSREVRDSNQNSNQSSPETTASVADQPAASTQPAEAQVQQPAAPQSQQIKQPKFMVNGEAKDLPNYPQAIMKSIQFGPIQGTDTLSLVLESRDPMEKIVAFYEKAIKSNAWSVDTKTVDPEFAEWNLKKAFDNEGKVQLRKDPQTKATRIIIARTEKITE